MVIILESNTLMAPIRFRSQKMTTSRRLVLKRLKRLFQSFSFLKTRTVLSTFYNFLIQIWLTNPRLQQQHQYQVLF